MSATPRATIKRRYDAILEREGQHARGIALTTYPLDPVSVWEVVALPLMVINHFRHKQTRDLFVKNYLFTKKLALQGALDLVQGDRTLDEVEQRVHDETEALIRAESGKVYGHEIRLAQVEEIAFLREHDRRLLETDGEAYVDLVRGAFGSRDAYEVHLARQLELERKVSDTALRALEGLGGRELAERMHAACAEVRGREARRIFDA